MKKMILALATAGALAAATALPAAATTISVGDSFTAVNGVTWGGVENDYFNISDAETGSENDAFDGFGRFEWYVGETDSWSNDVMCNVPDVTEDSGHPGDYLLTCDTETDILDGLDSQVTGRVYAEGDLMRLEYTVTNTSDAAQDVSWWSETSYGEAAIQDGADADLARGFDMQNSNYGYDEGFSFGLPGSAQAPDAPGVIDAGDDYIEVWGPEAYQTLQPGKSMTIVLFYFHDMAGSTAPYPSDSYESLTAWATDWFSDWNERLSRGIADDVFVANWMTEDPSSSTDDSLAGTGMDSTGALALAGAALVAGAAAMVIRRRRSA